MGVLSVEGEEHLEGTAEIGRLDRLIDEGGADLEVVTSLVELPANSRLPAHTHPGEEFADVIEGRVRLWEQGRDERIPVAE